MERDKLDNLLREKLDGFEVGPPADMWAKLDSELPEIRRSGIFGDGGIPDTDTQDPPVPFKIRRPNRRKMNWAYVAASIAACGVILTMMYNHDAVEDTVNRLGGLTEGNIVEEDRDAALKVVTREDMYGADAEAGTGAGTRMALASVPGKVGSGQPGVSGYTGIAGDTAYGYYGTEDGGTAGADTVAGDGTYSEDTGEAGHAEKESKAERYDDTYSRQKTGRDETSDIRRRGGFAASRARAELSRHSRRTTPVNTSFFAMNSGGFNSNGNVRGATMLSTASSLLVKEIDGEGFFVASKVVNKLKHDYPLTFGASVGIGITDNLSIETGLMYTYMKSEAEQGGNGTHEYKVKQKLHYLGIPVKIKYDFFKHRRVDLYASAGGTVEKLVSGNVTVTTKSMSGNGQSVSEKEDIKVKNLQTSVGTNIGVEVKIDRTVGIYIEPGVSYYIKSSKQPDSYRKENPLNFTLRAGFRINL